MRLQRLNMDNAWRVTLGGVALLVDPWLHGSEVDYFGWFNTQWHRTPPISYRELPPWDAVLITQKYPDHCHPETLRRLQPEVVFAPDSLEKRLRRLVPEARLHLFGPDARRHCWRGVLVEQLPTRRRVDPIYDAFVVSDGAQTLMSAPHGLHLDQGHIAALDGHPACTVLLSPFDRYVLPPFLGGVVTPGLSGLKSLVDRLSPSRVVRAHDEPKHGKGLIPTIARVTRFSEAEVSHHPWLADRHLSMPDYLEVEL